MSPLPGLLIIVGSLIAVQPVIDSPSTAQQAKVDRTDSPKGMGIADARHLLDRTCFGAPHQTLEHYASLTRDQAVDQLVSTLETEAQTPLPEWTGLSFQEIRDLRLEDRQAFGRTQRGWQQEARSWWAQEILTTSSPLTERLVLMWHGHFTSEMRTVRSPHAMLAQNQLFRKNGSDNFADLLRAVSMDNAMAIYLNTQQSKKGKPNENFARELFELFSLGEGHYTERDVKEAARAFTGYRVQGQGQVRKVSRLHDSSVKTVLGKRGRLDGLDVVNLVLKHPACGEWIARRFWLEFVSPTPDQDVIKKWGKVLRRSDWDLKAFLSHVFKSDQFWSSEYRGALVKSPVDLVMGSLRRLEISEIPGLQLNRNLQAMGQVLFDPPNVAGWPGGTAWIDTTSLLERRKFLQDAVPTAMIFSTWQKREGSANVGKSGMNPEKTPEMDPEMNPEMDPEMSPDMKPEMNPAGNRATRRLNRRQIRRYRPVAAQSVEKLYQQFIDGKSMNEEAWTLSWLPFQPVTDADQSDTGFGRLQELILDPTYQLK